MKVKYEQPYIEQISVSTARMIATSDNFSESTYDDKNHKDPIGGGSEDVSDGDFTGRRHRGPNHISGLDQGLETVPAW